MKLFKVMQRTESYQVKYVLAENEEQAEQKADAHGWNEKEEVENIEIHCEDLTPDPEFKETVLKNNFIVK